MKAPQGASEVRHKLVQVCLPFHTGHAKEQNSTQAIFQSSFAADETNLSGPAEIYHMGNGLSHVECCSFPLECSGFSAFLSPDPIFPSGLNSSLKHAVCSECTWTKCLPHSEIMAPHLFHLD